MRTSVLLSVFAVSACSDYTVKSNDPALDGVDEAGAPDIEVTPGSIAFGEMSVGSGITAIETVEVANVGESALQIFNITLEDPATPFTYTGISSVLIDPGATASFTVTYEPETAEDSSTRIIIDSNDPDEAITHVDLSGVGVAPVIQVDPSSYDFGTMYIGCESIGAITIRNIGNAPLVISEFDYVTASNDLFFDDAEDVNGVLPWTLEAGNYVEVDVVYAPLDDYADDGYLNIASNDPFYPVAQAHQSGSGAIYGENLDLFQQPIRGSSDILFIVDNSCSMGNEQALLADNFAYFAAGLVALDVDYQLAVITTDNPAFRGEIINAETDDIEAEFISQTSAGTSGSGNEMPAEMAYQSTESGGDAGPGSDFLRDDAVLSMIFISDEPDSSPSSWSTYLSYFESLKADPDNYVAHAISGDWPSGCADASATTTVYELTVATGGLYLSICATDWASHLEALVEGSTADLSSFELTQWPVPETIVVRVDGMNQTTGWVYNSVDRTVDFDETSIPEGGATIEVEYALFGNCDG